jgi:hypothetical protein
MIRKIGSKYTVISHTTGKKMGSYSSKAQAEKRLRQIQFFKNLKKSKGGSGSLKAKVHKKSLIKNA